MNNEEYKMKHLDRAARFFAATLLLAAAVGCAPSPTREGAGEYVDDSVITTREKTAIFKEPGLNSAEINVETFKGTVQLSGFVKGDGDRTRAGELTRQVKGVQSVKNDIRLK
jgi:osmotically-inducible protein OsmY